MKLQVKGLYHLRYIGYRKCRSVEVSLPLYLRCLAIPPFCPEAPNGR